MGSLHWLILFPYYFFTALSLYLVFSLVCRLLRAEVSANPLAMSAVIVSLVLTALPLISGAARIADYGWRGLVALLLVSLTLATVDAVLKSSLALPLDRELEDV